MLSYQIDNIYLPIFKNQGPVLRRIVSSDSSNSISFLPD